MTQEQLDKMELHIRTHSPYPRSQNHIDWANGFERGADYILSNPTDFGLVSMETMFEFCEWISDTCMGRGVMKNTFEYVISDGVSKDMGVAALYKLFTTLNKEK